MFAPKQDKFSMNDIFVARNQKSRENKKNKFSDELVKTESQKVSEDQEKQVTLEFEKHRGPVHNKDPADVKAEGTEMRRLASEPTTC